MAVVLFICIWGCSCKKKTSFSKQDQKSQTEENISTIKSQNDDNSARRIEKHDKVSTNLQDAPDASETISADELYRRGKAFWEGNGVKQDSYEAKKWLEKAAEKGHLEAQYEVGTIYAAMGDRYSAKKWLGKAADRGHFEAQIALEFLK